MAEHKRRRSQNNNILREVLARLRDYESEEVVIICNKYLLRRNLPPLDRDLVEKILAKR
ncbi:MAG: hypothetical protein LBV15_05260 [Planctomycetota bacterium]|jgi:hypothetical protein|nr:hypothetical protein [Planctomycetota bacterium]